MSALLGRNGITPWIVETCLQAVTHDWEKEERVRIRVDNNANNANEHEHENTDSTALPVGGPYDPVDTKCDSQEQDPKQQQFQRRPLHQNDNKVTSSTRVTLQHRRPKIVQVINFHRGGIHYFNTTNNYYANTTTNSNTSCRQCCTSCPPYINVHDGQSSIIIFMTKHVAIKSFHKFCNLNCDISSTGSTSSSSSSGHCNEQQTHNNNNKIQQQEEEEDEKYRCHVRTSQMACQSGSLIRIDGWTVTTLLQCTGRHYTHFTSRNYYNCNCSHGNSSHDNSMGDGIRGTSLLLQPPLCLMIYGSISFIGDVGSQPLLLPIVPSSSASTTTTNHNNSNCCNDNNNNVNNVVIIQSHLLHFKHVHLLQRLTLAHQYYYHQYHLVHSKFSTNAGNPPQSLPDCSGNVISCNFMQYFTTTATTTEPPPTTSALQENNAEEKEQQQQLCSSNNIKDENDDEDGGIPGIDEMLTLESSNDSSSSKYSNGIHTNEKENGNNSLKQHHSKKNQVYNQIRSHSQGDNQTITNNNCEKNSSSFVAVVAAATTTTTNSQSDDNEEADDDVLLDTQLEQQWQGQQKEEEEERQSISNKEDNRLSQLDLLPQESTCTTCNTIHTTDDETMNTQPLYDYCNVSMIQKPEQQLQQEEDYEERLSPLLKTEQSTISAIRQVVDREEEEDEEEKGRNQQVSSGSHFNISEKVENGERNIKKINAITATIKNNVILSTNNNTIKHDLQEQEEEEGEDSSLLDTQAMTEPMKFLLPSSSLRPLSQETQSSLNCDPETCPSSTQDNMVDSASPMIVCTLKNDVILSNNSNTMKQDLQKQEEEEEEDSSLLDTQAMTGPMKCLLPSSSLRPLSQETQSSLNYDPETCPSSTQDNMVDSASPMMMVNNEDDWKINHVKSELLIDKDIHRESEDDDDKIDIGFIISTPITDITMPSSSSKLRKSKSSNSRSSSSRIKEADWIDNKADGVSSQSPASRENLSSVLRKLILKCSSHQSLHTVSLSSSARGQSLPGKKGRDREEGESKNVAETTDVIMNKHNKNNAANVTMTPKLPNIVPSQRSTSIALPTKKTTATNGSKSTSEDGDSRLQKIAFNSRDTRSPQGRESKQETDRARSATATGLCEDDGRKVRRGAKDHKKKNANVGAEEGRKQVSNKKRRTNHSTDCSNHECRTSMTRPSKKSRSGSSNGLFLFVANHLGLMIDTSRTKKKISKR